MYSTGVNALIHGRLARCLWFVCTSYPFNITCIVLDSVELSEH